MRRFRVRNWEKFQHYKDRNPPWIKLHVEILSSKDWVTLDDASKLLAVICLVIAAKHDGYVPENPGYIRRVAYLKTRPNLEPLIACGFLVQTPAVASDSKHTQAEFRPETEAETETETETLSAGADGVIAKTIPEDFETFWKAYPGPRNSKKPDALKAWAATAKTRPPLPELLRAVENYQRWIADESRKQKRDYPRQHHSTWLRGEMWNNYGDGGPPLTPEQIEINKDRADRLMRRGKYAVNLQ